ncbi:unnamed protein product [Periconia digitata]|uniref:Porphobilinogen deaminase n=1 Tax=Periconia digitata TaxID=1303443 RepID=A0A9W4XUN7_9PLEO|nr:unnamed protein product [Periconia digitata]
MASGAAIDLQATSTTDPSSSTTTTAPTHSNTSASTQFPPIKIGTRRSALAQIQARWVEAQLKRAFPDRTYNICPVLAQGDKDKVTPLQQLSQGENAKSLWTGELEAMLEEGELDMIVHCLKDMPTQLPPNLKIGAILAREDPRDALILSPRLPSTITTVSALPAGSKIGTSSIRRAASLRRLYPHLEFGDVRGNVGTRLGKLDAADSPFAGIILAAAGLKRMGMEKRISQYLSSSSGGMLHAVGQGALAIEVKAACSPEMEDMLAAIRCERSSRACEAERGLLRALEGGCSVPIGVETSWRGGGKGLSVGAQPARDYDKHGDAVAEKEPHMDEQELVLKTLVVSVDGTESVEFESARKVRSVDEANQLGRDVARILMDKGADRILAKISEDKKVAAAEELERIGKEGPAKE